MIDAERLRQLMKDRGWSQARLARLLNVSPPAIQQILSGKTKTSRLQRPIARLFDISEEWLTGESDSPFEKVSGSMSPEQLAHELRLKMNLRSFAKDEGDDDHWYHNDVHDPSWLKQEIAKFDPSILEIEDPDYYPEVFTSRIVTDAMAPTMLKGDHVLISMRTREVRDADGIWLISYGGLAMIRRLMPLPHGGFRVSADNPASPTFEAPVADIHISGRAFWIGRSLT